MEMLASCVRAKARERGQRSRQNLFKQTGADVEANRLAHLLCISGLFSSFAMQPRGQPRLRPQWKLVGAAEAVVSWTAR